MLYTKKSTRLFFPAIILVLITLLASCSSGPFSIGTQKGTAKTSLYIDREGVGYREIVCSLNESLINNKFTGGKAEFDNFLQDRHPGDISVNIDGCNYTFKLEFNSVSDYTAKVERIIGAPVNIAFSCSDSVFSQGFRISESFSSSDLFKWFYDATYDENILKQGDTLWDYTENNFMFEGQQYPCQNKIEVSQMTYETVEKVSMATVVQGDNNFERTVSYSIPQGTIEKVGTDAVENYMKTLVPGGAKAEWNNYDSGRTFTIGFTSESIDSLLQNTNICMGNKLGSITCSGEDDTIFNSSNKILESIDLSSFPSNNKGTTFFEYKYKFNPSANHNTASLVRDGTKVDLNDKISNGELTVSDDFDMFKINIESSKKYDITDAHFQLIQSNDDYFKRILELNFSSENGETGADITSNYVNNLGSANLSAVAEGTKCTISSEGSLQQINSATSKLFSNQSRLSVSVTGDFSLFNYATMEDTLDLASFFKKLGYNGEFNYTFVSLDDIININGHSGDNGLFVGEQNLFDKKTVKLTTKTTDKVVVTVVSQKLNVLFLIGTILVSLLLIGLIVVLIMVFISKSKNKEEKTVLKDTKIVENIKKSSSNLKDKLKVKKQDEVQKVDKNEDEGYDKCVNCGAVLYEGMKFCVKCGKEFDSQEDTTKDNDTNAGKGGLCPKCNSRTYEGMRFCIKCGYDLKDTSLDEKNNDEENSNNAAKEENVKNKKTSDKNLGNNSDKQETKKLEPDSTEKLESEDEKINKNEEAKNIETENVNFDNKETDTKENENKNVDQKNGNLSQEKSDKKASLNKNENNKHEKQEVKEEGKNISDKAVKDEKQSDPKEDNSENEETIEKDEKAVKDKDNNADDLSEIKPDSEEVKEKTKVDKDSKEKVANNQLKKDEKSDTKDDDSNKDVSNKRQRKATKTKKSGNKTTTRKSTAKNKKTSKKNGTKSKKSGNSDKKI